MTYRGRRLSGPRTNRSTRRTGRRNTADSKAGRPAWCTAVRPAVCRTPSTQSVSCAKRVLRLPCTRRPGWSAHTNTYKSHSIERTRGKIAVNSVFSPLGEDNREKPCRGNRIVGAVNALIHFRHRGARLKRPALETSKTSIANTVSCPKCSRFGHVEFDV